MLCVSIYVKKQHIREHNLKYGLRDSNYHLD